MTGSEVLSNQWKKGEHGQLMMSTKKHQGQAELQLMIGNEVHSHVFWLPISSRVGFVCGADRDCIMSGKNFKTASYL